MTSAIALVAELKQTDQDFEWYPTTKEILDRIRLHCKTSYFTPHTVIDIGAGDGRVLEYFRDELETTTTYAIEKATPMLPILFAKKITLMGADFWENTLIDKKADLLFCNPPYSEYEPWFEKIILETSVKKLFMVVPARWVDSPVVTAALEKRHVKPHILGTYTFENAPRRARCVTNLLVMDLDRAYRHNEKQPRDPFDIWFDAHFPLLTHMHSGKTEAPKETAPAETEHDDPDEDFVDTLVRRYTREMAELLTLYQTIQTVDWKILSELGVSPAGIKEALWAKIRGKKTCYWQNLFEKFKPLTSRLIATQREAILSKLTEHQTVDFTRSNALAVVMWVLQETGKTFDEQLVSVYKSMWSKENCSAYKSNRHVTDDSWRYLQRIRWESNPHESRLPGKIYLEYRIILQHHCCIVKKDQFWSRCRDGLAEAARDHLLDIFVVAHNLAFFDIEDPWNQGQWTSGGTKTFYCHYKGERVVFAEVRGYYIGTLHIKFHPDFVQAMNIEAARILGWVKSPQEAAAEIKVDLKDVVRHWESNFKVESNFLLKGA